MAEKITQVVAITPVWNEDLGMIQAFKNEIEEVRKALNRGGIGFRHFFLSDGAIHLPDDEFPILVRHEKNLGLAQTLLDGYQAVLALSNPPEVIVRLDCQEHDPSKILEIVENMEHSPINAVFMPVYYWIKGANRPPMKEVTQKISGFIDNLSPVNKAGVLATYNQVFPIGYQAYRREALESLLPQLKAGVKICEELTGKPATWGLDLLAILLAGDNDALMTDFIWGGWAEPWLENRGADKVNAQRTKAEVMVEVAIRLGCRMI